MEFENIYKSESYGDISLGVEINISSPVEKPTQNEKLRIVADRAAGLIKQEMIREFHKNSPVSKAQAEKERWELLNCFNDFPIWVEPIPNGYCSLACCEHLPWYLVTTKIGVVKIGWRKRVIEIDWSRTSIRKVISADEVTKDETMIHAWGYDKAKEYLTTLLAEGLTPY